MALGILGEEKEICLVLNFLHEVVLFVQVYTAQQWEHMRQAHYLIKATIINIPSLSLSALTRRSEPHRTLSESL